MDDWKVGDLALCIASHSLYPPEVQPGTLHTVEYIWHTHEDINPAHHDIAFDFVGVARMPGDLVYWRGNFRRVTPEEPDEFDYEVICDLIVLPSPVFTNQIGDTAPVAAPSPEAANNGSGRGAVVICLGAPALSQTLDDTGRDHSKRLARPVSIPFHHGDD